MKKTYTKPQITLERFTLNTNIAGDCEVKTWTPSAGTCAYTVDLGDFGTRDVFTSQIVACKTVEADGEYNSICYHVPSENNTLFNS